MKFILCLHAHLPDGTPEAERERAFRDAYLPVVETLVRHPDIKFVLSYSGHLLESTLLSRPEFTEPLGELLARGQIELLSTPMYEPILPAISERDRTGQIRLHQSVIERAFGVVPRGLWIPEFVWEPSLPLALGQAGVEYVPLDDTPFLRIGFTERRLFDSYMTEDGGMPLRVFPSPRVFRQLIPFARPEEVVAGLIRRVASGAPVAVYADVAEKFGYWPGTRESVTERGWLSRLLALIGEGQDRVQTITFSEYVDGFEAGGTAYLPTGSTVEMLEWSLPPSAQRRHHDFRARLEKEGEGQDRQLGVGFWRNFFARYPEANWMHKRGLDLERRLGELEAQGHDPDGVSAARRDLWRSQCHNAYWHGVTGGMYVPELRERVYANQIRAWRRMDEMELGRQEPFCRMWHRDVNLDGHEEVVIENREIALTLTPDDGGTLRSLDVKGAHFNVLNAVARREEAYHRAIREGRDGGRGGAIGIAPRGRSGDLARYLNYDAFPLHSVRDHLMPESLSLQALKDIRTLPAAPARTTMAWEREESGQVSLFGAFRHHGSRFELTRRFGLDPEAARFDIEWSLRLLDGLPEGTRWFATEWTLGLPRAVDACRVDAGKGEAAPDAEVDIAEVGTIAVLDRTHGLDLALDTSPNPRLLRFPVETVSLTLEHGAEPVFQGCRLFFVWKLDPSAKTFRARQSVNVRVLQPAGLLVEDA